MLCGLALFVFLFIAYFLQSTTVATAKGGSFDLVKFVALASTQKPLMYPNEGFCSSAQGQIIFPETNLANWNYYF